MAEVAASTEQVKAEIAATREEWEQKRTRLQTDFDNFRSRHFNMTKEAQLDAKVKLLQQLLPVIDNFDRARGSISPSGAAQEAVNANYLAMNADLMAELEQMGVAKIETIGAEFDYNLHMAIQQVPSDEYPENTVCSELQPGYLLEDKLVRAAYVMVSSG